MNAKLDSTSARARVVEVFSSLQGEGVRLGERQIFVRFGGCNLHCDYCDEPETIPIPSGTLWTRERLESEILALDGRAHAGGGLRPRRRRHASGSRAAHRSISWTGGEPLLHVPFLKPMMEWARERGFENYLETNGTLPRALEDVKDLCGAIAMDLKLPSATGRKSWASHLEFLKIAPERTFAKIVLTQRSTNAEIAEAIELVKKAGRDIPLILQPATIVVDSREALNMSARPGNGRSGEGSLRRVEPIEPDRAIAALRRARSVLKDARLIPQWHPVWAVP